MIKEKNTARSNKKRVDKLIRSIRQKVANNDLRFSAHNKVNHMDEADLAKFVGKLAKDYLFLEFLSYDEIDKCDGSETLEADKKLFDSMVTKKGKFISKDTDKISTPKTKVRAYNMKKELTLPLMFEILNEGNSDLRKLCFTQHQIKKFCRKNCKWLSVNTQITFFLFMMENRIFVADIRGGRKNYHLDGQIYPYNQEDKYFWGATNGVPHRIVVPLF